MIRKLLEKRPWQNPIGRSAAYAHKRSLLREDRNTYLFESLGEEHIAKPSGRGLIAYTPEFIRYLFNHPEVGPRGWESEGLQSKLVRLSHGFSYHQMNWESAEMVRQLIGRGFIVDYVCGRHGYLVDDLSKYDVIIDEWTNLPTWAALNRSARKLFYATGSHWIFHNKSEVIRHEWLFRRKGVQLSTNRQIPQLTGDVHADLISSFGNSAVNATFGLNAFKIRRLCTTAVNDHIRLEAKDWPAARRCFMYFASSPWFHKGLDLVVEAFLQEPDLKLNIVTSGVGKDSDFWEIYGAEIERAPNITVSGFIDVLSPEFYRLAASCSAFIFPSASEGCSGSAVQAIHYGLIPIVTETVGLEIHPEWPALIGQTDIELINEIRERCRVISQMHESQLEELRRHFWQFARTNHTRTLYKQLYSGVLDELIGQ